MPPAQRALRSGLAADHGGGRRPARPGGLAADPGAAGPGQAFLADADAVADRPSALAHEIEIAGRGVDDDGAGLLAAVIGDLAAQEARIDLGDVGRGQGMTARRGGVRTSPRRRGRCGAWPVAEALSGHAGGKRHRKQKCGEAEELSVTKTGWEPAQRTSVG